MAKSVKQKPVPLSSREIGVVKLICKEYSNEEIAAKLGLSKRTVEGHRIRIMRKLKKTSAIGVVIYAIKNGLFKI